MFVTKEECILYYSSLHPNIPLDSIRLLVSDESTSEGTSEKLFGQMDYMTDSMIYMDAVHAIYKIYESHRSDELEDIFVRAIKKLALELVHSHVTFGMFEIKTGENYLNRITLTCSRRIRLHLKNVDFLKAEVVYTNLFPLISSFISEYIAYHMRGWQKQCCFIATSECEGVAIPADKSLIFNGEKCLLTHRVRDKVCSSVTIKPFDIVSFFNIQVSFKYQWLLNLESGSGSHCIDITTPELVRHLKRSLLLE